MQTINKDPAHAILLNFNLEANGSSNWGKAKHLTSSQKLKACLHDMSLAEKHWIFLGKADHHDDAAESTDESVVPLSGFSGDAFFMVACSSITYPCLSLGYV